LGYGGRRGGTAPTQQAVLPATRQNPSRHPAKHSRGLVSPGCQDVRPPLLVADPGRDSGSVTSPPAEAGDTAEVRCFARPLRVRREPER